MNILHIVEYSDSNYGGPAKSIPTLINYLESKGYKNTLISGRWKKDSKNESIRNSTFLYRSFKVYGPKKACFCPSLLFFAIKNIKDYDAIHIHNHWNFICVFALLLKLVSRVSCYITIRGSYRIQSKSLLLTYGKKIFRKYIINNYLKRCDTIVVTNKDDEESLKKFKNHIVVAPNIISRPFNNFETIKTPPKLIQMIYVGRIHPHKRLHLIIPIVYKYPQIQLVICGLEDDKIYKKNIIELINTLELDKRVTIKSNLKQKELNEVYREAEISVSCSLSENFGMSIAEGLSVGLFTIAPLNSPWKNYQFLLPNLKIGSDTENELARHIDYYIKNRHNYITQRKGNIKLFNELFKDTESKNLIYG